jgi:(4-(4-[2-(gamma-L-glutamylamino)ethyl]phenoxymethyl)furan-2-yl)methanamine synthase
MTWLGIDIGGANLKAADGRGWALSVPIALWRHPQMLAEKLGELVERSPAAEGLAATMTGELCDCFNSKAEGVRHILDSIVIVAKNRPVRVYCVDGRFATPSEARKSPKLAAASNWQALANFVCRYVSSRTGLLIDVGSTTTDVIPLVDGQVAARGRDDTERLISQELLYRGVGRTPICALTDALPLREQLCPIAAEMFATTADAYLLLDDLNEDLEADWTADGRPLTKKFARQRLARQLCADTDELQPDDFERIANTVRDVQHGELTRSIQAVTDRMPAPPSICVLSGSGEFLAETVVRRALPGCRIVSLAKEIGLQASTCAPAHAIAVLAAEAEGREKTGA